VIPIFDFSGTISLDTLMLGLILIDIKFNQMRIINYLNKNIDNGGIENRSLVQTLIPFK